MKRALLSLVALGAFTGMVASTASASDWGYQAPQSHHAYHDALRHEATHEQAAHRAYDYGYSRGNDYGYSNHGFGHPSQGYGYGGSYNSRPSRSHWSFGFGW